MIELQFCSILAQAGAGSPGGAVDKFGFMLPMILLFGVFYFMLIRPQQRKEKERRAMIESLKSGERVVFCGGIMGTIANVKDGTFVVKIADNVKVEVLRGAVSRVIEKGEKIDESAAK